jgi:hypothetical protein
MPNSRPLTPPELRQLALAACPELAAAFQLAERVAMLNPDAPGPERIGAGMLAQLVGEARAIANGHSPRDALRVSHADLQERLTFMVREYGGDMATRYPGAHRYTREALEHAHRMNPCRDEQRQPSDER